MCRIIKNHIKSVSELDVKHNMIRTVPNLFCVPLRHLQENKESLSASATTTTSANIYEITCTFFFVNLFLFLRDNISTYFPSVLKLKNVGGRRIFPARGGGAFLEG